MLLPSAAPRTHRPVGQPTRLHPRLLPLAPPPPRRRPARGRALPWLVASLLALAGSASLARTQPTAQPADHAVRATARPRHAAPSPAWEIVTGATAAWIAGDEAAADAAWRDSLRRSPDHPDAWLALAVLARERFDWLAAERYHTRLQVALRDRPRNDPRHGVTWLERSRAASTRGRLREALLAVDSAVSRARDAADTVTLASALASAAALRGRVVSARSQQATLDSLVPLRSLADPALQLRDACTAAARDATEGDAILERLSALLIEAGAPARTRGTCYFVVGAQYSDRGWQRTPNALFHEALRAFRLGRARFDEAVTQQWLGSLYARAGQPTLAEQALAEALRGALAAENGSLTAWVHVNLAATAKTRGEYARAERSLAIARTLAAEAGDQFASRAAQQGLVQLHLQTDRTDALTADLAVLDTMAPGAETAAFITEMQADAAVRRGDLASARDWLARADSLALQRGPNWRPAVAVQRAWVDLRSGDARRTIETLDTLRARFSRAQTSTRRRIDAMRAEAYLHLGHPDSAAHALHEAFDHADWERREAPTSRIRAQAAATTAAFGGPRAEALPQIVIAGLAQAGRAAHAFALGERRRARALLQALLLAADVSDADAEQAALSWPAGGAPLTLTAAQAALPDAQTALISFHVGSAEVPTAALVVTRDAVAVRMLPPVDSLAPLVQRVVAAFSAPENDRPSRRLRDGLARQLGDALLGPILDALPAGMRQLVLVPDDLLHRVPFAALRPGGRAIDTRLALSTVPSATIAAILRSGAAPTTREAVVLAAPTPPAIDAADAAWQRPLPGARAEAQAVRRALGAARVFEGAMATEARLRDLMVSPPAILHIAAHAVVDDQEMDAGVLVLGASEHEDGFVTPSELSTLRLAGALVVLSGCRTARGPIVGGEGVRGLVAPLLVAGAGAVLSTQWDVGDDGLAPLVARFYRELARGRTAAEALRRVQVEAQARGRPAREWAALTLVGNGDWRLPPRERR